MRTLHHVRQHLPRRALFAAACLALTTAANAQLRIVSYNIEADVNGNTAPNPGTDQVLEAIGAQTTNGFARKPDIICLQETTSNSATVQPLANSLATFYGVPINNGTN